MDLHDSIRDTIGRTPVVRLHLLSPAQVERSDEDQRVQAGLLRRQGAQRGLDRLAAVNGLSIQARMHAHALSAAILRCPSRS